MKSPKPKEKLNPTEVPDRDNPFRMAMAQKVVLQSRANGVIYKGTLTDILSKNYLLLVEATVIGRQHTVEAPWLMLDASTIQHMHTDGLTIERRKKKEE